MTEFINGRVLSKYIENRTMSNIKNVYETQFYLSFLFVVLDYLNNKNICHRDLKPDNIMLDENGYLKVIDFGTSIEIKNYTSTITGTPHYISPEVLVGKSYSFSCDYWSVGIIAHEIFYNYYPFGNKAKDPMDVYREIIKKDLKLPKNGNPVVNNFIKCLLKKKINERICSFEKIKKQEFYKDFNWDDLMEFKLKAPYIPNNNKLMDFENYDKKYLNFVEEENKKEKKTLKKVKSDEIKDKKKEKFDPNWADAF
jgi:cGMP-dependent protein kinase